jgi:hypothetical protein
MVDLLSNAIAPVCYILQSVGMELKLLNNEELTIARLVLPHPRVLEADLD